MLDDVWAEEFESCHQGQTDTLVDKKYTMLRLKPNHFSECTLNVFAMISGHVSSRKKDFKFFLHQLIVKTDLTTAKK